MKFKKSMSLKLLLVDDDEMVLYLHQMMLKISGFPVRPVCLQDGREALTYLLQHYQEGDYYLILLDINMPVMNGWKFLEAIQKEAFLNKIAVIMVTSSIDAEDKLMASRFPEIIDFVEKPIDLSYFKNLVSLPQVSAYL